MRKQDIALCLAVVLATLAGSLAGVFKQAMLINPFGVPPAEKLVTSERPLTPAGLKLVEDRPDLFAATAGYVLRQLPVLWPQGLASADVAFVTPSYFDIVHGRTTRGHMFMGTNPFEAVIRRTAWDRLFGSSNSEPSINIGGQSVHIVGAVDDSIPTPLGSDAIPVYMPLVTSNNPFLPRLPPSFPYIRPMFSLRPGVAAQKATDEVHSSIPGLRFVSLAEGLLPPATRRKR